MRVVRLTNGTELHAVRKTFSLDDELMHRIGPAGEGLEYTKMVWERMLREGVKPDFKLERDAARARWLLSWVEYR